VGDGAAVDVLDEQAISVRAPVVLEHISRHYDVIRVHDRHAGPVRDEAVVEVVVVVGEHEVEPVALVMGTQVARDHAVLHELKVDAVAVARYLVVLDVGMFGIPEVDAVAVGGFACPGPLQLVAADHHAVRVLHIDAKEGPLQMVVLDGRVLDLSQADGRAVLGERRAHVAKREATDGDTGRDHGDDFALLGRVDHRGVAAVENDGLVHHQAELVVQPGHHADGVARLCECQGRGYGGATLSVTRANGCRAR
jgi:hypothetical protein